MTVIRYTEEELLQAWDELFITYPWLNGWSWSGSVCEEVFCCPDTPPNWGALDEAKQILWLLGKDTHVKKISMDLNDYEDYSG
jgi:hypothetical protein